MIQTAAGTPTHPYHQKRERAPRGTISPSENFINFYWGSITPNILFTMRNIITPTETPYEAQQNTLTPEELISTINLLSNANKGGAQNIRPNAISGYGASPMDMSEVLPKGVYDRVVSSQADADALNRAFGVMQSANDYGRQQRLDNYGADVRQENLYGEVLADMLAQQAPAALTSNMSRPVARQRDITGAGTGGWIPENSSW